ncbi:MAG: recombinase family protein [Microbacteriaceae bacterium]
MYVRQSTLLQVREHTESLARQYELRERAVAFGWDAHQVRVIDADLGRSGSESTAREGFQELVADVGLGRVGIIFGIEVSRLARNNTDWYQLLDLCALTNTLIADSDGVYHPGEFNDRLVLGLKGTMSEAELHLIRSRLTAGLRHKAARGELRQGLPVGFDYDPDDQVVFSTDEAVVEAIALVFRRFAELGSARQVLLTLREDGLLLPRRPTRTGRISWVAATYPAVHDFVTNPCYAGAFVFGRNRSEKRIDPDGRVITRTVALPREQWAVLIPEHHPGFIDWATYEANTAQLRANWRPPRGTGGGPAREGAALLQGRIRCGRCGRMMQTGYSGTKGNCPRYLCARAKQLYGGEKGCQSLPTTSSGPVRRPCLWMIRCRFDRAGDASSASPQPTTNSLNRACSRDGARQRSLSRAQAQPKTATAGPPPEVTVRDHHPSPGGPQVIQARYHPADVRNASLRDVQMLVPRVLLFVTLAEPTPSGSTDASRLCRGCSHPHRHLPEQAAPSYTALLRQDGGEGLSPPLKSSAPHGARGSGLNRGRGRRPGRPVASTAHHSSSSYISSSSLPLVSGTNFSTKNKESRANVV